LLYVNNITIENWCQQGVVKKITKKINKYENITNYFEKIVDM